MTKVRNFTFPAILFAVIALGSCGFGLQPAWQQTGDTTIKIDFSQTGTDARAISLGTGYLYIRTVGGPEGDNGPLYGPYTVNTPGVFATSDIPAGTYSKFCICYAAISLDDNADFMALVSASDAEFLATALDDYTMSEILDGDASGVILSDVVLAEGAVNLISAVLLPFNYDEVGSYTLYASSSYGSLSLPDVGSSVHKKFIHVTGLYGVGGSFTDLICEMDVGSANDPCTVSEFRIYSSSGKLLYSRTNSTPVAANVPLIYYFPYAGATDYYIYIEYTYDPTLIVSLGPA